MVDNLPPPQISIIIPNYNRADAIPLTFLGLSAQSLDPQQFEVIFVDDGSSDDSLKILKNLHLEFRLKVIQQKNAGPASARNKGIQLASGEILLFLDVDMIPDRDLLKTYLEFAENNPWCLMLGRQLAWEPTYTKDFLKIFQTLIASDPGENSFTPEFYFVVSNNLAVPMKVMTELNGFDDFFRACEDVELGFRAFQKGIPIQYIPSAIAYHNHPKTIDELYRQVQTYAYWTGQLVQAHPKIYSMIPIYKEVEPVNFRNDPFTLIFKKIIRRVLAASPIHSLMKLIAQNISSAKIEPDWQTFFYKREQIE